MRVGFYVIHVPGVDARRDENAAAYAAQGFTVYEDVNRDGPMAPGRAIIEAAVEDGCDWALIVQDDALGFEGWETELGPALVNSPSPLLSLSHFASVGEKAAAAGFAYGQPGQWGPAFAYRRDALIGTAEMFPRVLALDPRYPHDDGVGYAWAKLSGAMLAFTSRALFDHPPWRSTLGHPSGTKQRRPFLTILDDGPPWDTPGVWRRPSGDYETPATKEMLRRLREVG